MSQSSGESSGKVGDIGSRLELFVDDWLIERMDRLGLTLHQPVSQEIALKFDRPWEGTGATARST